MISAAEASADRLGAALLGALRERTSVVAMGMGGPHLAAAGFDAWRDSAELSVVGLVEVVAHLPRLLRMARDLVRRGRDASPDVAILIDAPDFHLRLARGLRQAGIRVVLFVPPAVWASRPQRVARFAAAVDLVMVLFPFEVAAWAGVPVIWVGHPLRDEIPAPIRPRRVEVESAYARRPVPIALLPGSRPGELTRHLPVLRRAAELWRADEPGQTFTVALANPAFRTRIEGALSGLPLTIFEGPEAVRDAVGSARGAWVASGTATLETALLGCPQVVLYRLHPLTYAVARRLIITSHWALPNVLMKQRCVPECIQHEARAERLVEALRAQLVLGPQPALTLAERLREALGPGGAANRAADAVIDLVTHCDEEG